MAQGTPWDKDKVIEILEPFFKMGCSVNKACNYAGIPQSTVQTWIDADEELRLKITAWQNEVSVKARKVVVKSIESENLSTSMQWLEKKEKDEFADRKEITGAEGGQLFPDQETKDQVNGLIDEALGNKAPAPAATQA